MYIINGVCYAGSFEENIEIQKVKALDDKMLILQFSTGEIRLFDAEILHGNAFESLKDEAVFRNITIDDGAVTWLNGTIDCAPEYMYKHSYAYEKDVIFF